jgi:hypothetical protein
MESTFNSIYANVASQFPKTYVVKVGPSFTRAYRGAHGYVLANPERLRLPSFGYHFWNEGGFLGACNFYAAIFRDKPCVPDKMSLLTNNGSPVNGFVSTYAPEWEKLVQIAYDQSRTAAMDRVPKGCIAQYDLGEYPNPCAPKQ